MFTKVIIDSYFSFSPQFDYIIILLLKFTTSGLHKKNGTNFAENIYTNGSSHLYMKTDDL